MTRRFDPAIEISVVIPCYNEEENAEPIAHAVIAALAETGASFEILFIDNGSQDRTVEIVKAMCAADPRVKLIANAGNFGQMRSPTHAIYQAQGRAIIGMCADFQDPPALLPELIARWRAGAPIVLGVRASERSAAWLRAGRAIGYGLLGALADYHAIPNATGFGIYDRNVVDALAQWNEPEPFFRGMLVESGYPIETIAYPRPPRAAGKSKNNFGRLLDFWLTGLANSPKKLLRLPFQAALFAGLATVLCGGAALAGAILGWACAPTFGWIAFFELHFAILCLFLGLMGDQLRLIAQRTRGGPLVVERERVNLPPAEDAP